MNYKIKSINEKYKEFTKNIKKTLNKAIERDNYELVQSIQLYLEYIDKIKNVSDLNREFKNQYYEKNLDLYEKKIENLQNKIIKYQFQTNVHSINETIISIPKYNNDNINLIVMFLYKFININSYILCIIFKNIVNDLFNIKLIKNLKSDKKTALCNVLENTKIIYNSKTGLIENVFDEYNNYTHQKSIKTYNQTDMTPNELELIVNRLNKYNINKILEPYNIYFNHNTIRDFKIMIMVILCNILQDLYCHNNIKRNKIENFNELIKSNEGKILDIKNKNPKYFENLKELNKIKDFKEEIKSYNKDKAKIEKTIKQLNKDDVINALCKYIRISTTYKVEKEYDILYNYLLSRNVNIDINEFKNESSLEKNDDTEHINITIPKYSVNSVNNLVIFGYNFIRNNKEDICDNLLKLMTYIGNIVKNKTSSMYSSGSYFHKTGKILSLCGTSDNIDLINTFYLKYDNLDKIILSKLLKKIIKNDGLKISYNSYTDSFSVKLINIDNLKIDFEEVDKDKIIEGLNTDLKCINEFLNKKFINNITTIIKNILNTVLSMISDVKVVTNMLNITLDKTDFYALLKNEKLNFKIRKLCIIFFIKFFINYISDYNIQPLNKSMYEDIIKELHEYICYKINIEFNYDITKNLEDIYKQFPTFEI